MNKKIKKILSSIFPSGQIKDIIKLLYYNFSSPNKVRFKQNKKHNTFITEFENKSFVTNIPLYTIYRDFNFYTNYYRPKEDDLVLDIGANYGIISLYLASILNDKGIVYSIEPDSNNLTYFENNLTLNPKYKSKIIVDNSLIWSKITKIEFHEDSSVASSIFYKGKNAKTISKKTTTLDSWCEENNITKIDFIKMDIEGAEIEAIIGAKNIIKNFQPNFAIASYHIINGEPTYLKLEKLFTKLNYPCKTIKINQTEIITYAGPSINTFANNV